MKTATSPIKTLKQPSSTQDNSVIKHQTLNTQNSNSNLNENNLGILDDTDLELEKIMFEEFAHGLPSDIPMADW
ncbi:hypothetical protein ACX27_05170 [Nostoc piscinale CENA21]|uniref:Uncharacterized protein n=1 Tax=Nostoc piscinale CENA21 TaxID=224013 RepID=A0A0M3V4R1_9NOSO|nr:hypothetical protein [Nostoc piscinale]ALF52377.1 hypothetical protein ACX27_05170 [Nostoc piscinale CENA21]